MIRFRNRIFCRLSVVLLVWALLAVPARAQFTQQGSKLVGTGAIGTAGQGFSVALSGDGNTAIVGGPFDNNFGNIIVGAAWVYTRSGAVWSQQAKLVGTGVAGSAGALQGNSVSLSDDGNTAIVGGPFDNNFAGAAWVFTRSGGVWSQQAKLVGTGVAGSVGASQGSSVSLSDDGNTAIEGGPFDADGVGAAWVFTRMGGVWSQQAKLVGSDAVDEAEQGISVSLSGDGNTGIVGGPNDNNFAGAAWVYTRSGAVWSQQAKLVGTGAVGNTLQGHSVALSGDGNAAIVGGPFDSNLVGAAWLYMRLGGVWGQQAKLVGTGAVGGAEQGISVSLSGDGNTAIVGGPNDDELVGAAWVFAKPVFAGTPGKANCHGKSVSALARQFGGLNAAAAALGFPSVQALQDAIMAFCET